MNNKSKHHSISGIIVLVLVILNALILKEAYTVTERWYLALIITLPLLVVTVLSAGAKTRFTQQ